jgi:hypothetical protein
VPDFSRPIFLLIRRYNAPSHPLRHLESMASKRKIPNPHGRKGIPLSLAPLTMDEVVDAMFQMNPDELKIFAPRKRRKRARRVQRNQEARTMISQKFSK